MIAAARRHVAVVGLALLLVAGAMVAQLAGERNQTTQPEIQLASGDAGPNGALALALWLDRLGYQVEPPPSSGAAPSNDVGYFFVLRPWQRVSDADARSIVAWVRRGGTLIYVPSLATTSNAPPFQVGDGLDRQLGLAPVAWHFGTTRRQFSPSFPFFQAPPASSFSVAPSLSLEPADPAWLPIVMAQEGGRSRILVARRRYGAGQAIAIGSNDFLANAHLGDADNSALILNVLARGLSRHVATFDEYHHGEPVPPDLLVAARASPWGWAIAYLAAACFLFALWSGRRFGAPIVREKIAGRSTGDYVAAFAGLLQRGGVEGDARAWAQAQYNRVARRSLARAQGVRADLPAPDLARLIATRRPIDPAELAENLERLAGPPISERALLDVMRSLEQSLQRAELAK